MALPVLVSSGVANLPEFDADSSLTIPVTVSGTNAALVVKIASPGASDVVNTVTYAGVTVPEIRNSGVAGAAAVAWIFVLPRRPQGRTTSL